MDSPARKEAHFLLTETIAESLVSLERGLLYLPFLRCESEAESQTLRSWAQTQFALQGREGKSLTTSEGIRRSRCGSLPQKRVDHADKVVVLSIVEVLGEECGAPRRSSGGENRGIPIGRLVAFFDFEGVLHHLHGERDNAVAKPVFDQCGGLCESGSVRVGRVAWT